MASKKKVALSILAIILVVLASGAYYVYQMIHTGFNIDKTIHIYIDADKDYAKLLRDVEQIAKVKDISAFERVASFMEYPASMKTGKYAVTRDMDIVQLVRSLRSGNQVPEKITFNNMRLKGDLTTRISEQLMFTKQELDESLNNPSICTDYGFDTSTIVAMFIPNTYEFYWDVKVESFLSRMHKEYTKFWTDDRKKKASELGLTPVEVSTLASIVEEECTFPDEYPIVAGLYLNRLRRGQKLEADPTVKFAIGDFSLRRILYKHLEVESPYNTYRNVGLPPSPIRIPSIKGIDGVLNPASHNYLFMCAKEDFSGRHSFATNLAEHERNANRYRQALNKNKIYQ